MRLSETQHTATMLATVLSTGPASLICEYDGGCNYLYLGAVCKDACLNWSLPKTTALACVVTSVKRMEGLPPGPFRTKCLIHGLARAVDNAESATIRWIVTRLPKQYALYSDQLTSAIIETGVVSAIRYAISCTETSTARPLFRDAAIEAVRRGHADAAKYLCTRFTDSRIKQGVSLAASLQDNVDLIQWCADNAREFTPEAVRALGYRGNVDALEYLKQRGHRSVSIDNQLVLYTALGGNVDAIEWAIDNSETMFSQEEVCLMVSAKGLLSVLQHLVQRRGFDFNAGDCIRFAKKESGVACWLMINN